MTQYTKEFFNIINELMNDPTVMQLKNFRQHYSTTRYAHCLHVSYHCYLFCKKHNLDYVSAARAGLLHDLFLYDWRVYNGKGTRMHAFKHPRIALNNAMQITTLNAKEKDIILKHMWPLTVVLPKYKESYIITIFDKYCTLSETWEYYRKKAKMQKIHHFAYILLSLMLFK